MAANLAIDPDEGLRVPVASDDDLVAARRQGRRIAEELGFSKTEATLLATAISELARNIVLYARSGEIVLSRVVQGNRLGVRIIARDQGPGIADIDLAMHMGYSSAGGLGLGLPGVRRIMDEFDLRSEPGAGTVVTVIRWRRR